MKMQQNKLIMIVKEYSFHSWIFYYTPPFGISLLLVTYLKKKKKQQKISLFLQNEHIIFI